jgi:membrane-bound lytic murein transglycosylase B
MDRRNRSSLAVSRRESLRLSMGLVLGLGAWGAPPQAQARGEDFSNWVELFRARARARGVSDATYTHVMQGLKPDTEVLDLQRDQPEFGEKLWQYLNRRVSDWRIEAGKERRRNMLLSSRASNRTSASIAR